MEREKQEIEEMAKEMLEISTSANVEPVLEIDGKEIILDESATRVLDNILEQAFIPYLAENLYNAGYRKERQGEWISVEDRLPDENEMVLIYCGNYDVVRFTSAEIKFNNLKPYLWKACCGTWFGQDVKYWMPLPQPPKMKGVE